MHIKIYMLAILSVALIRPSSTVNSQTVDPPYEVGLWQGFCDAAITYTLDDWCSNQYPVAVPIFNEFDYDVTFFPVTGWSPNYSNLNNVVAQGHEVGSHTTSHPHLGDLTPEQQDAQLKNSQNTINSEISGQQCLTIAYPFCEPGIDTICSKYYIAARHCQGYVEQSTPPDFLTISSIMCGSEGTIKTTKNFNDKAANTATSSGWCVYLIHGIDDDGGYSSLSSTILRESLEYLDANRDKYWVSTFGNVVRYIRERNSVSVTELSLQADSIIIGITDTLDNTIYNFPVSIRRPLPAGWPSAMATQNGLEADTKVMEIGPDRYIVFDAIPDNGDVILVKSDALAIHDAGRSESESEIAVWMENDNLLFTIPENLGSDLQGRLYNIMGANIAETAAIDASKHRGSIQLSEYDIKPGIYILCLFSDNEWWKSKVHIMR